MTRSKKLIVLIVVLAVCVAGYFTATYFLSDDASSESVDLSVTDVEKISWTYDSQTYEIKLTDDTWYYSADEDFPLSQDSAEDLSDSVSSIYAIKKISDTIEDESKYGIDEPTATLTLTDADSEEHIFKIGNYNEATGYYYLTYSGDEALYYVDSSLYSTLSVDIMSMVEFEYIPAESISDVTSMTVECASQTMTIKYYPDGKDGYSDSYTYFVTESDSPCDTDTVEDMIAGFVNVGWLSCEAYNVTADNLGEYGLDTPSAKFTVNYTYTIEAEDETGEDETVSGTKTLLIGNAVTNDDGETVYYAMIKDGSCVYTVSENTAKLYMISAEASLYSKQILDFYASELESLSVTVGGNVYNIDAAEDLEADSEMSYKLNGTAISLDTFIGYLEDFEAESVETSDITDIGDLLLSVTLNFNDSTSTVVEIYEYDPDLCVVSLDGKRRYFASENECDDIYDEFRAAVKAVQETVTE